MVKVSTSNLTFVQNVEGAGQLAGEFNFRDALHNPSLLIGTSNDTIERNLDPVRLEAQHAAGKPFRQVTNFACNVADGCERAAILYAHLENTPCQHESNDSSDEEWPSLEDTLSPLAVLQDTISQCLRSLFCHRGDNISIWRVLKSSLSENLELVSERMPSFGDDECEAQLKRFKADLLAMSEALKLDVGDGVKVEYIELGLCPGKVVGLEDVLLATGAQVQVRYDSDGMVYTESLSDGGVVPVIGGSEGGVGGSLGLGRAARGQEAERSDPPFHVARACTGKDTEEAMEGLRDAVMVIESLLERAVIWAGRRLALSLRQGLAELRWRAMEVRGRLTDVWPTPRLEAGGMVVVRNSAGGAVLAATVARVGKGRGGREGADLVVEKGAEGRVRQWVPRDEWALRVASEPAGWPGGDGMGDVRRDDPDWTRLAPGWDSEDEGRGCGCGGCGGGETRTVGRKAKRPRGA